MFTKNQFYFYHIPKTAGSSLKLLLQSIFKEKQILPCHLWSQLIKVDPFQINHYDLIAGHFYNSLYCVTNNNLQTFTFLRDPLDRALSHYGHIIKHSDHYLHSHATRLGSFSAYLRDKSVRYTISNFQARALCFNTNPLNLANNLSEEDIIRYKLEEIYESGLMDMDEQSLYLGAKSTLEKMRFIGLTEQFEKSARLLCNTFNWQHPRNTKLENINLDRLSLTDLSQEDYMILKEINRVDIEIYSLATSIFNQYQSNIS